MDIKKCTGNRFTVTNVVFDNPVFEVENRDNIDVENSVLKSSVPEIFTNTDRRKSASLKSVSINEDHCYESSLSNPIFADFFKDADGKVMDYNQEIAPRLECYRNSLTMNKYIIRPSLDELRKSQQEIHPSLILGKGQNARTAVKFGWIKGVYIRCLLNIWGVMLFMRMGWMTGQCGIGLAVVIVLLCTIVTIITTTSMSAICTNGDVYGGGAYYLISRSLGPEFGAIVGIILFLANAVSGAMYVTGTAEAIKSILNEFDKGLVEIPSGINDVRIISFVCLLLIMSITGIGVAFENKTEMILLVILLTAIMDYLVGACLPPTTLQKARGFLGWDINIAITNFGPVFRGETFFSVFSVFFPTVTGIMAGANISGDLKEPCIAIPKGTFLSILTTSASYVLLIICLGFTMVRDATGSVEDYYEGNFTNCTSQTCTYGLINDYQVMAMAAGFGPLVYAGIFAATLSSALVTITSAPRILQALCQDGIIPQLNWFGKGFGSNNEPRRALVLTFIIAVLFTLTGNLNAIAPIISNFFMAANGLINFSCFHASYVKSPGFRPGFRYYNLYLSLFGALICAVIMFVMNWVTALITDIFVVGIYVYICKTSPDINWGSSFQGYSYRNALHYLNKLSRVEDHVKNFRPAILVLSGRVTSRPQLVDIAGHLTKKIGLQICADISKESNNWNSKRLQNELNMKWLLERNVKAFYCLVEADSLRNGVCNLIQTVGIGKMKPNIVLMGFKQNWKECDPNETLDYFHVIHDTLDAYFSLAILRMPGGKNCTKCFETEDDLLQILSECKVKSDEQGDNEIRIVLETMLRGISQYSEADVFVTSQFPLSNEQLGIQAESSLDECMHDESSSFHGPLNCFERHEEKDIRNSETLPPNLGKMANFFHSKQEKGTIDVWWLYDDGGLTILLPYILTTRSHFKECKLKIFSVAQDESDISNEQLNLAALLQKFRIPFKDLIVLSSVGESLHKESLKSFKNFISEWIVKDETREDTIRNTLNTFKEKTNQLLRLRGLLEKHSKNSNLVVMTLPLPRKDGCPAALYMAWLDILTNGMPPFLLVRGNQTSVLTFYS